MAVVLLVILHSWTASTVCDECSASSSHEFVDTWSCETSIEAATLVPLEQKITYKLCLLMHLIHSGHAVQAAVFDWLRI